MPFLDRPAIAAFAVAYFAIVLALGVWAARRTRTAGDFFIAGQGIGLLVTGLATMSAATSGFVFLGGPGLTYRLGTASFFVILPVGWTAGLMCWTVAKRLRLLAAAREIYTIPDAVQARYGSRGVAGVAAVAVLVGTVAYLGAQLQALGIVVEAIFGTRDLVGAWSPIVGMAVGLAVILAYSVAGGMVAGVYTDVAQGVLMMAAGVLVFVYALAAAGGPVAIARSISASESFGPAFLDPLGTVPAATAFGFLYIFGVGILGQPQMVHKFFMLDDVRKLRWMPAVLSGGQGLAVLIWVGLGLAVPALVASGRLAPLTDPDQAAPAFLLGFAPDLVAGLAFTAVLAAIMSTADSFVNIGSAALVRDLPKALGLPVGDQLRRGRWATVWIALAAAGVAYAYGDLIALLGTFAFGTFAAALAPSLAVGLNWKRVGAAAAGASMVTGVVLNVGLELLNRQTLLPRLPPGVPPAAVALASSFAVLFLVSWWTGRHGANELPADIAAVMDS